MTEFAAAHNFGKLESFLIAGASKRGWTTWLTPAVDERIVAIVPIVMPMLNMGT
jgi:PhoPQ-activated pathogenicity-related protein